MTTELIIPTPQPDWFRLLKGPWHIKTRRDSDGSITGYSLFYQRERQRRIDCYTHYSLRGQRLHPPFCA